MKGNNEMEKKGNGIASLIIVIFAVIGVACATLILLKKLKERKLVKDNAEFDDLCDAEDEDLFNCECPCEEEKLENEAEEAAEENKEEAAE